MTDRTDDTHTPHRRPDPGRPADRPRRRSPLLRAGRKLSRRARRAARRRHRRHRVPAGGRRGHDGGGLRQADRAPRHLLRHARARRDQRLARHPHRPAGFDAADPVRRPGRARHARARGLPGARLPRRVRLDRQMGDRDRRPGAPAGARLARLPRRDERPARPGRDRAAGGHADRDGERRRRPALRAGRDPSGARPDGRAAEAAVGGRAARSPILGGSRWSAAAVQRFARFAERFELPVDCSLPPPDAVPGRPPLPTPAISASGRTRSCSARIKEADLVLLVGGRLSEMPSQSYTLLDIPAPRQTLVHVHPDAGRARPRLSPASCRSTPRRPRSRRRSKRVQPPAAIALGASATREAHADYLAWSDPAAVQHPGRAADGRGHGASARDAAGRRHPLQRRRQLRELGAPLLAVPRLRHAARADLRLDGLRRAGGRRGEAHLSRTAPSSPSPATATS